MKALALLLVTGTLALAGYTSLRSSTRSTVCTITSSSAPSRAAMLATP
ncbi:MAG TPA: hypothetical protein VHS80_05745 [Chthoniobacterales bacterium]|nr:hypothetical protein [Chthoniobacterales bacterium]